MLLAGAESRRAAAGSRLARRLGVDGSPLRRRTDKIAACAAALLLAVFVTGAPLLSVAAAGGPAGTAATELRAARSWHQVSAVLLQDAAAPDGRAASAARSTTVTDCTVGTHDDRHTS